MDQGEGDFDLLAFWKNPTADGALRENSSAIKAGEMDVVVPAIQEEVQLTSELPQPAVSAPVKSRMQTILSGETITTSEARQASTLKTTGMSDEQVAALAEKNRQALIGNIPKSTLAKDLTGK